MAAPPTASVSFAYTPRAAISSGGTRMGRNLSFSRGDTVLLDLAITVEGVAENLTGATVYFTAKQSLADADTAAVIRKSNGALTGVTIVSAAGGTAQVQINPADTASLPASDTILYYDVQLKRASGQIFTVADGELVVYADVTISTS